MLFRSLVRSDCKAEAVAFDDIPVYETMVMAARMPIITMTTNNSTIVKAGWYLFILNILLMIIHQLKQGFYFYHIGPAL